MKQCMEYVAHDSFKKALLDKKKQSKTKRASQQRIRQHPVFRDEEDVVKAHVGSLNPKEY